MSYDPAVRNRLRCYMRRNGIVSTDERNDLPCKDLAALRAEVDEQYAAIVAFNRGNWIPSPRESWLIIGYFVLLCAPTAIVLGALGLSVLWEWLM